MEKKIFTKIKAGDYFWQYQMKKLAFMDFLSEPIMSISNELFIQGSIAYVESDVRRLSEQNPEELLVVTSMSEDLFENLVTKHGYQYGRRRLIEERYEYFFDISKEEQEILPPGLWEKFQQLAVKHFHRGDKYRVRNDESDPTFQEMPVRTLGDEGDSAFVPSVELVENGFKIQAKKFGLTYLMITVKQTKNESSSGDYDHLSEECDDWISEEYENPPSPNPQTQSKNCGDFKDHSERIIEHLKTLK